MSDEDIGGNLYLQVHSHPLLVRAFADLSSYAHGVTGSRGSFGAYTAFMAAFRAAGTSWDERRLCRAVLDVCWAHRHRFEVFGLISDNCAWLNLPGECGMTRGKWILFFMLGCVVSNQNEWESVMGLVWPDKPYDAARYGVLDMGNVGTLELVLFVNCSFMMDSSSCMAEGCTVSKLATR